MQIQKFEQSGLLLTSKNGYRLAIDIAAATPLEHLAGITADGMLVSHIHGDHCSAAHITALAPEVLFAGAECVAALKAECGDIKLQEVTDTEVVTIGDFTVQVFSVDHGPNAPKVPEQNFGFLISEGEEVLYFAGDMYTPSGIDVSELSVTYACLPVGGHYTFDHEAAFTFAKQFAAIGKVIPLHYADFPPIDTNGANNFKALAENAFTVEIL